MLICEYEPFWQDSLLALILVLPLMSIHDAAALSMRNMLISLFYLNQTKTNKVTGGISTMFIHFEHFER